MALLALVLDVDGTLAETERDGHRPAFNTAFAEAGLDWHWDVELYRELLAVTGGKERIRHYCALHHPDVLARPDADRTVAALHAAKTRHYVALVESGRIPLRPGVARLIGEARAAGTRLAIATTTSPENVTALLVAGLGSGAADWFEVVGAGDVVAHKKPAPDVYRWVLQRLGVRPQECLAVEDSAAGLRSALAAGVPTVLTPSADTDASDPTGALAVLPDLASTSLQDLIDLHAAAPTH